MNIEKYTEELSFQKGFWTPKNIKNKISYPSDGNAFCYQLEDTSYWFNQRNKCILACINNFHSPGKDFFDIGGGNGFVTKFLQDNQINACLLEPGIDGVLNAQKRNVANIIFSTMENCVFKENSIPAMGFFDVIEHIEDDYTFMKTSYKYLEKKGNVFITVPAFKSLWSQNDITAGHFRRYTSKSLEKLLTTNGFKVSYISYFFQPLVLPLFLLRTIPYKLGLINENNVREKSSKHHQSSNKTGAVLSKLLNRELSAIMKKKRMNAGTSIIAVARKN